MSIDDNEKELKYAYDVFEAGNGNKRAYCIGHL